MTGTRAVLRLGLVGPLPPPSGGMANQTRQLGQLLRSEGLDVDIVRTNAPYTPSWIGRVRGARALFRFVPYHRNLRRAARAAGLMHVMANSGWAWFLFAVPAIRAAARAGIPVVVNYRGGLAREFLERSAARVRSDLRQVSALVVPSGFLQEVFAGYGIRAQIIPNVVDLETFRPAESSRVSRWHLVMTRNLEPIYGTDVAIRAAALLARRFPSLRMSIAGTGPESDSLRRLVADLGLSQVVQFTGRLEVAGIAQLYRDADVAVNASRADNTPNALLEAAAAGVPIVTTDVGGIPYLLQHGQTAWIVPSNDPERLADGIATLLDDAPLRDRLRVNALSLARSCAWSVVREQWLDLYDRLSEVGMGRLRPVAEE